mgnify:CR=1 FL=1
MKELGFFCSLMFLLNGCATMETLKKSGEEFSEGNVVMGTVMLLVSPLMLVPDIFTLGGALDDKQSSELWTGAASQYVQSETMQQQKNVQSEQRETRVGEHGNRPVQDVSGSPTRQYWLTKIDPACVTFEEVKELTAYVGNRCSVPIKVTWCWVPQGLGNCTPDSTSDVIAVGQRRMVHGPGKKNKYASYVVCDATSGDKPCLVNR